MPRGSHITEHIIIGTPGKVLDWGVKFKIFDLKKIRVFVLDEADVMIATQGHQDQCIRIHKYFFSKPISIIWFLSLFADYSILIVR